MRDIEVNKRFSMLYSTLLNIKIDISMNDLYLSNNFKEWIKKPNFGLYLFSNKAGSGKTTTALKLVHVLIQKGYSVLAVSMIDYKNLLKKEFGKSSNDLQKKTFYDYIYRYDYIFIDDITYFAKSEWLDEVVKDLMDHCFNNKKPIPIFTAQCSIQGIQFSDAIKSRIIGTCKEIQFPETDYRKTTNFKF